MTEQRYLITSDIHGDEIGLGLIKKAIERLEPTLVISAGDQCPDIYEGLYSELLSVRGNCDRFYEYGTIPFPPLFRRMRLFDRDVIITHGDRYWYDDFQMEEGSIFISGHTHVPGIRIENGIYLFNPGSPSRPRSSSGPTAGLLTEASLSIFSLMDFEIISALSFSDLK